MPAPPGSNPVPLSSGAACWNRIGVGGDRSCVQLAQWVHCRNCPIHAEGARQLFDRPLPPGYRSEWTRRIATPRDSPAEIAGSAVIFRVAAEWLALPTDAFELIMETRPVHHLLHRRHEAVLGLVNVRGELWPCVSLRILLGIAPPGAASVSRAERSAGRLLVLRDDRGLIAVPADEVHGVHRYESRSLRNLPSTVVQSGSHYSRTLLNWQDRSVAILDAALLFQEIDRSLT